MADLPQPVLDRLEMLKKDHKHRLQIKLIRGGYYVYEEYSRWDSEAKRVRTYTLYVGKIEPSGEFVKPHRKSTKTSGIKNVEGYIRARSAEALDKRRAEEEEQNRRIIEILSTNSRTPLQNIADEIGITRQAVMHRIKNLEERFGIEYVLDMYIQNFNLYRYIITIKFEKGKPSAEDIKSRLENDPNVQFVAFTKGEFDLFIYVIFPGVVGLEDWLYNMRKNSTFIRYKSEWRVSYITGGGFRFRDIFFTGILSKKVWQRTREQPRRKIGQIFRREYAVLQALNRNSKWYFKNIDREYNLGKGTSNHTADTLIRERTIERCTLTMQKPPIKYTAILTISQNDMASFEKGRQNLFLYMLMDKGLWSNRFTLMADISSPANILLLVPIYEDGELERVERSISDIIKGNPISSTIITNVVFGSLIINKVEPKRLYQYRELVSKYKMDENEILKCIDRDNPK